MASEIKFAFDKGSTLYARVFNDTGQVWNTSDTPAFEDWADGSVTDYDISLTDKSSGQYIGNFPTTAAGRFKVNIYEQAGVSPATDDEVVGTGEMLWGGTSEIFRADEDDVSGAHTVTDALIGSTFTTVFNIYDES